MIQSITRCPWRGTDPLYVRYHDEEWGVPYMLDNHGEGVNIKITPLDWPTKVIGHYRLF